MTEDPCYPDEDEPVAVVQFGPLVLTLIDVQLLPKHEIFKNQVLLGHE